MIMYRTIVLPKKCTDRNKYFCTSLARCSRRFIIVHIDCKVYINKKPTILLFSEYNIACGDITVEDSSI